MRHNHLRESVSIEMHADIVLFIHRVENESKLIVGKHRLGDKGSFPVTFDAKRKRFYFNVTIMELLDEAIDGTGQLE